MGLLDALRAGRWCDLRCTFHSTRLLPSRPSVPPLLCGHCQLWTAAPSPPSTQWGLLLGCPSQGSCSPCLLLPSYAAAAARVDALAWHPPHLSMQDRANLFSMYDSIESTILSLRAPAENIWGKEVPSRPLPALHRPVPPQTRARRGTKTATCRRASGGRQQRKEKKKRKKKRKIGEVRHRGAPPHTWDVGRQRRQAVWLTTQRQKHRLDTLTRCPTTRHTKAGRPPFYSPTSVEGERQGRTPS